MDEVLKRLLPRPPPPFASTTKGGTLRSRPRGDGRAVPPESFATLAWPPKGVSFDSGMDEVLRRLLPRPPPPFASTTKGGTPCFQARGDGRAVPPECAATFTWHQKGVPFDSGMDEVLRRLLPRPPPPFASTTKGGTPCFQARGDGRAVPPESFATLAWPPKGVSFDSGMDEEKKRLLPRPRRLLLAPPKGVPRASKREETVERSLPSAPRPSLGIKRGYPSTPAWMKF